MKDYILYVDDNEVNLHLFAEYFSDQYEIICKSLPTHAWEVFTEFPIKVIVSDQLMPDEDGLTFLSKVHKKYPDIIKILCTAYADDIIAIRAINQGGIFRFITKPYSYEHMGEIIAQAINEFNLRLENKKLINELKKNNSILQQAFNQIKEQQQKLYAIFMRTEDGIIVINKSQVIEVNPAFIKIFRLKIEEKILATCTEILQKKHEHFLEKLQIYAPLNGSFEYELIDENSKKRYIETHTSYIDFLGEKAIMAVVRDITDKRESEQKILEAIISTQENEQKRYAQELHDGIGPLLSTLKMYIEWISNPELPNHEQIINYALVTIDETIKQSKNLANKMSSHLLERFGLVQALNDFLEQIKKSFSIQYNLITQLPQSLSISIEMSVYRILMESINNTLKYAHAKNISIELKVIDNNINIFYKDDGIGFDYEKVKNNCNGMGLFNIQNRINALKGKCQISSSPNQGFQMNITIPLK